MQKQCFKCKIVKGINDFYKHSGMADGHLGKCKECTKQDVKNRYDDPVSLKRITEYERKRFQDPKRKKKLIEYQRVRRKKYPLKNKARAVVRIAVRSGYLKKKNCEVCGDPKTEAHHTDYNRPLKVMWLCRKHHLEKHGKRTNT